MKIKKYENIFKRNIWNQQKVKIEIDMNTSVYIGIKIKFVIFNPRKTYNISKWEKIKEI